MFQPIFVLRNDKVSYMENRVIDRLKGISLSEMEGVKLMSRRDRKFCINSSFLCDILSVIENDYYVLEINGERNLPYSTTYYDTTDDNMYNNHHRGKKNRYKIRRRNYVSTDVSFLEIKFKSNKGRTIKTRQITDFNAPTFNEEEREFIQNKSPYQGEMLTKALENRFNRITLVSKNMNERCTIDSNLFFLSNDVEAQLDELIIIEVKTEGRSRSVIIDALNKRRYRPTGFSKYCMGRSITDSSLKQNRFKAKHRRIERLINTPLSNLLNNKN